MATRVTLGPRRNVTSSGANIAASGGGVATAYVAAAWYAAPFTTGTTIPFNGILILSPIGLPKSGTITDLAVEVTVAGTAGAVVRIGIYADNGNGYPGSLVLDAGTVDGTTTGVKTITLGTPLALAPGRYWIGAVNQGAPATSPTLRVNGGAHPGIGAATATFALQNQLTAYYNQTSVAGALPATFDATPINATTSSPRVAYKLG